jgi:tRNA A-37 threonylcarbamoyl transferase component Bud32
VTGRDSIPQESSRYDLLLPLARGGMAQVYVGQKRAAAGFTRLVAIKKAHRSVARDAAARAEVIEEVRIASKIHHPHLVAVHDVEELDGELLLIMDYVEGANVAELIMAANRAGGRLEPRVAMRIVLDCCVGLHAAHSLRDEHGRHLALVHRDVSPQNILVGVDGLSRVTDFGIAKSRSAKRMRTTGKLLKGKVAYMAPEYVEGRTPDARVDVFALGVVLWEMLANDRLFRGDNDADTLHRVLHHEAPPLSTRAPSLPRALEEVLVRALTKRPDERFATAQALADALEAAARKHDLIAGAGEVGAAVEQLVGVALAERRAAVRGALLEHGAELPDDDDVTTTVLRPRRAPAPPTEDGTGATGTAMTVTSSRTVDLEVDEAKPASLPFVAPPPARPERAIWPWGVALLAVGAVAASWGLWGRAPEPSPAPEAQSTDEASRTDEQSAEAGAASAAARPSQAFATTSASPSAVASPSPIEPGAPPPGSAAPPPSAARPLPVAATTAGARTAPPPQIGRVPPPPTTTTQAAPPAATSPKPPGKYGDNPY